jgi:hypothetical protein
MPPPIGIATSVAMPMATNPRSIQLCSASSANNQPKNAVQPPMRLLQMINRIKDMKNPRRVVRRSLYGNVQVRASSLDPPPTARARRMNA